MKVNSLHIGDIHFGISNTSHLYMELSEIIPKTIIEKEIKIVFISGDYFEKELVGSHKYYATKFFAELAAVCNEYGVILRMIKGTKSHDQHQLLGFFGSTKTLLPDLDFKIIDVVEEEELLGLKILYIPEEELLDQIEHYAPFRAKKYNIIAGHGTWDFVNKAEFRLGNNALDKLASPIHLVEEWLPSLENGFCVFGHIHSGQKHENKFFYTSSFSRWKYGEEEPKGFLVSTIDNETFEYEVTFIENTLAPKYNTASFESVIGEGGLQEQSLIDVRRKLRSLIDKSTKDKIRINVTNLTPSEIVLLQKAARTLDNVDLAIESKRMEEILLEEQEENNAHDYVIHPEKYGLTPEDVIIRFAKENNEEDILMTDLIEVIREDQ